MAIFNGNLSLLSLGIGTKKKKTNFLSFDLIRLATCEIARYYIYYNKHDDSVRCILRTPVIPKKKKHKSLFENIKINIYNYILNSYRGFLCAEPEFSLFFRLLAVFVFGEKC